MKTAISIPDDIFEAGEHAAKRLRVSRSELYPTAAPGNVSLARGSVGLNRESVVNVSQMVTLDKRFLAERVGRLPEAKLRLAEEGLRVVLAL